VQWSTGAVLLFIIHHARSPGLWRCNASRARGCIGLLHKAASRARGYLRLLCLRHPCIRLLRIGLLCLRLLHEAASWGFGGAWWGMTCEMLFARRRCRRLRSKCGREGREGSRIRRRGCAAAVQRCCRVPVPRRLAAARAALCVVRIASHARRRCIAAGCELRSRCRSRAAAACATAGAHTAGSPVFCTGVRAACRQLWRCHRCIPAPVGSRSAALLLQPFHNPRCTPCGEGRPGRVQRTVAQSEGVLRRCVWRGADTLPGGMHVAAVTRGAAREHMARMHASSACGRALHPIDTREQLRCWRQAHGSCMHAGRLSVGCRGARLLSGQLLQCVAKAAHHPVPHWTLASLTL
jgi:hypothetical protein